ncbi:hypothetical protein NPIL_531141 [Nephila pilipes]|uniref:Uncharacterized protein n=1 Tax=Nephila pilipes TaxID=299642 RepID=A0A8X6U0W4_NEPPI|nr:hypothetical protein NPIL_531141 [Nephila pilipes]
MSEIPQLYPAKSLETSVRTASICMANYLISEGILNDRNAPTIAMAFTKSFENIASEAENKYKAVLYGFVNFVTSLTPMTPERGLNLAQKCEDAVQLENDRQSCGNFYTTS